MGLPLLGAMLTQLPTVACTFLTSVILAKPRRIASATLFLAFRNVLQFQATTLTWRRIVRPADLRHYQSLLILCMLEAVTSSALDVKVSGNYALLQMVFRIEMINVSNPANPNLAGHTNTAGSSVGVAVSGTYAFVANVFCGLQVFDIANPANPMLLPAHNMVIPHEAVAVSGNYAYVAASSSGLKVFDISNPPIRSWWVHRDYQWFCRGRGDLGTHAYMCRDAGLEVFRY